MKRCISVLTVATVFLTIILFAGCSRSGKNRHFDNPDSSKNNKKIVSTVKDSAIDKVNDSANGNSADNDTGGVPDYAGEYICISLNQYVNAFSKLVSSHAAIPPDMETMYGMSWINGYVIDPQKKDVILVGQQRKGRPVYHAEDLFVNYQNVFDSTGAPLCSLDPDPEHIRRLNHYLSINTNQVETLINNARELVGGQKVVVEGVPLNSRAAKIMIYADYEMKKISQGLVHAGGMRSALDFAEADQSGNMNSSSMSRYWFHIKPGGSRNSYPNYNESEGIVFINQCPVVVLTAKQLPDRRGNLVDDISERDEIAQLFAAEMSNKYDTLAAQNSLIAELENMYRLQACLRAIQFKNALSSAGADFSAISGLSLKKGGELPKSLPGLLNYKKVRVEESNGYREMFFTVAGGVDQAMEVSAPGTFRPDHDQLLIPVRQLIINKSNGTNPMHFNIVVKPKKPRLGLNNRGNGGKGLYGGWCRWWEMC